MGGSRRLPWVLVGILAMVVTALAVVLVMRDDDADTTADPTPPADSPTASATATTSRITSTRAWSRAASCASPRSRAPPPAS